MKPCAVVLIISLVLFNVPVLRADTCDVSPGFPPLTPLTDFAPGELYKGFPGFLYDGSNNVPAGHDNDGLFFASKIQPRDTTGKPSATGRIVFLGIGFSNATIEFCGANAFFNNDPDDPQATSCPMPAPLKRSPVQCTPLVNCPYNQVESFMGQAFNDPGLDHTGTISLVDGAKGGETLADWDPWAPTNQHCPADCWFNYERVDAILASNPNLVLSAKQVQSIWLKSADSHPTISLPDPNADAFQAERFLGDIMRAIRMRYPNARQVFISPRIYGGYANNPLSNNMLNPEPFAYELGFAIKWLIQAQISEINGGPIDPIAGDLRYSVPAPGTPPSTWINWGPYLWADGNSCKAGFACLNSDMRYRGSGSTTEECTHPSTNGEQKVGAKMLDFMKTAPYTGWFRSF